MERFSFLSVFFDFPLALHGRRLLLFSLTQPARHTFQVKDNSSFEDLQMMLNVFTFCCYSLAFIILKCN